MRVSTSITILILCVLIGSCRKDFETIPSFGALKFSKDTVFLDTIFSSIGSATYNLKVYNTSANDITIPEIKLENGIGSNYRLNVDGIPGKDFENVEIRAKDSIFVFIETTIDYNTLNNPLYTDRILFDNGNNQQDVDLVTLVQDAVFIYPGKDPITMKIDSLTLDGSPTSIKGRFLKNSELNFTNDKPYVIYGYAAIADGNTLDIAAGTKIYFHQNSGIIVDKNASLKANGTLEDKIIFEGDRLENRFNNTPGQWGTIWMRAGSMENYINHTVIKNNIIGILVDSIGSNTTPTLQIQNSEIYNNSNYGIFARSAAIEAENIVIGNNGQASLACTIGGSYRFTHATIGNFWNTSIRTLPAVIINNYITLENNSQVKTTILGDLLEANFTNCIITGNNNVEFLLDKIDGTTFNYNVKNTLFKFNDVNNNYSNIPELDFSNQQHYQNNIQNGFVNFKSPLQNNLKIGKESDAINAGIRTAVSRDILNNTRDNRIDSGAYQYID
ncbi:hypothetical protein [Tenacibaculum sp. SG-28]|uniref:hypothetical protein n=1 Tax=Tenacibaculum sp. SG-28 TaxID=754426 RepID=UPI000CF55973|nr:hypothetical protein [Tenacibaculum sp. SG-28]PQJ22990.1 hypothetical protein BSU00_01560 [Tenacibaculum sp. SG-28]